MLVGVGVGDGTKCGSHLSSIGLTASLKPATSHWAVMVVSSSFHTLATRRLAPFILAMNASTSGAPVVSPPVDNPQTPSAMSPSSNRTATVGRESDPRSSSQKMIASSPFSCSTTELNVHRTSKSTCIDVSEGKTTAIDSLPVRRSADAVACSHAPTNGVGVIVGVSVGSGVGVIVGVFVGSGEGVGVGVSVGSGVGVGVGVGIGVGVLVAVRVGVGAGVRVFVAVGVGVLVAVSVGVGTGVYIAGGMGVAVGTLVGVFVGRGEGVAAWLVAWASRRAATCASTVASMSTGGSLAAGESLPHATVKRAAAASADRRIMRIMRSLACDIGGLVGSPMRMLRLGGRVVKVGASLAVGRSCGAGARGLALAPPMPSFPPRPAGVCPVV